MSEFFGLPITRQGWLSWIFIALMAAVIFLAPPVTFADDDDDDDMKIKELVTVTGDHPKQQFAAGKRVEVSKARVADDIFAAGRDLTFEDVSAKNVIAAGMSLSLTNITADDLILAGGELTLSGNVKDDIIAAVCPFCPFGGRMHLMSTSQIGDDARLAGRDIAIDGRIGGDLYSASEQFKLSGEIVGNARIEAERIVLSDGARIGGDLVYSGPDKPEIAAGAIIAGETRQVESILPDDADVTENWVWYAVAAVLAILLALIVFAGAMQMIAPGLIADAARTAREQPWSSLGRGLAVMLLVPAIAALLMATVVGIPVGVVMIAAFVVLMALAYVTIAYCIGTYLRGRSAQADKPLGFGSRLLWTVIGIFILFIIGLVPFVGWAVTVLAMFTGLGAVVRRLFPRFQNTEPASQPA